MLYISLYIYMYKYTHTRVYIYTYIYGSVPSGFIKRGWEMPQLSKGEIIHKRGIFQPCLMTPEGRSCLKSG